MEKQYYYANFPTKLYQEKFKNAKDKGLHLAAMGLIVSFVHTNDGYFYLTERKLAEEIGCSSKKSKRNNTKPFNLGLYKTCKQREKPVRTIHLRATNL